VLSATRAFIMKAPNGLNLPNRSIYQFHVLEAHVELVKRASGDKFQSVMLSALCMIKDNTSMSISDSLAHALVEHNIETKLIDLM
jgi:hypothetical protein